MVRLETFMKGFLIGFCSCSILLFCLNINTHCQNGLLQSSAPMVPAADNQYYTDFKVPMKDNAKVDGTEHKSSILPVQTESSSRKLEQNRRGPRILCWVMTTKSSLKTKAVHVYDTWGKRCDKILFFISNGKQPKTMSAKEFAGHMKDDDIQNEKLNKSEEIDTQTRSRSKRKTKQNKYDTPSSNRTLPVISLESFPEGRDHLTAKTMNAFNYIYHLYLDKYDWFLKADDDTYVVMENLRHFLSHQDKNIPVYFGHHFVRLYIANGYNSGGSGYVLSQAALRRFGARYSKLRECVTDGEDEDVDIGRCLQYLGVGIGNTADQTRAIRFVCFSMEEHFLTGLPKWTENVDAYGAKKGIDSISRDVISFHYVQPWMMYALDYFVYRFKLRSDDDNEAG